MGYYADLSLMSIGDLKTKLLTGDLLKSRMLLRENIDTHFRAIQKNGINNTEELKSALKTKKTTEAMAKETGVPLDYLTLLRREINSYHPQPRMVGNFPQLDQKVKAALNKIGIKTTVELYEHILTPSARKNLSTTTGLTKEQIVAMARLTDFCRLQYVNETFATLLLEAGFVTVQSVANADPDELHRKVNAVYKTAMLSKCSIGLNDMRYLIRLAADAQSEIQW